MPTFTDRREAGRRLAAALAPLAAEVPVVVGLPRGGVPVAAEVARALGAPLDVIVVRKLGVPTQPELGMGAVGEDGVCVRTDAVADAVGVAADAFAAVRRREQAEVEARARRFRAVRPAVPLAGRTVIVVDDGLATGGTARAAVAAPGSIVKSSASRRRTAFIRSSDSRMQRVSPVRGTDPPTRPVLPPCGTTAIPACAQTRMQSATSAVVAGRATSMAGPR